MKYYRAAMKFFRRGRISCARNRVWNKTERILAAERLLKVTQSNRWSIFENVTIWNKIPSFCNEILSAFSCIGHRLDEMIWITWNMYKQSLRTFQGSAQSCWPCSICILQVQTDGLNARQICLNWILTSLQLSAKKNNNDTKMWQLFSVRC